MKDSEVEKRTNNILCMLSLCRTPVVITRDQESTGFESNMQGRVVAFDYYEKEPFFVIDATEFREHNKSVAKHNYYDSNNKPVLNVFEAGFYNDVDKYFQQLESTCPVKALDPEIQKFFDLYEAQSNYDSEFFKKTILEQILYLNKARDNVGFAPVDNSRDVVAMDVIITENGVINPGNVVRLKECEEDGDIYYEVKIVKANSQGCNEPFKDSLRLIKPQNTFIAENDPNKLSALLIKFATVDDELLAKINDPNGFAEMIKVAGKNLELYMKEQKPVATPEI